MTSILQYLNAIGEVNLLGLITAIILVIALIATIATLITTEKLGYVFIGITVCLLIASVCINCIGKNTVTTTSSFSLSQELQTKYGIIVDESNAAKILENSQDTKIKNAISYSTLIDSSVGPVVVKITGENLEIFPVSSTPL